MFKSMQEKDEINVAEIIEKNLKKWGNQARLDDIMMIDKIGKE
jgi:hypothetical protein